jgi:hypothetical protein
MDRFRKRLPSVGPRSTHVNPKYRFRQSCWIFLTANFGSSLYGKSGFNPILTSYELAAATFGASSTHNLRNETASDIIAKSHSP